MTMLSSFINLFPPPLSEALRNRFIRGPIETVDGLIDFVQTRSSYIAQTSLFGYLKERMGTSYPKFFEDEVFVNSINAAKLRVYRACLSDLCIYAAAAVAHESSLSEAEVEQLSLHCFSSGLDYAEMDASTKAQAIEAFQSRASGTNWPQAIIGGNAFSVSPVELVAAAPVIEDFKRLDSEIVVNSISFRWRDVKEQFGKRIRPEEVRQDFRRKAPQ